MNEPEKFDAGRVADRNEFRLALEHYLRVILAEVPIEAEIAVEAREAVPAGPLGPLGDQGVDRLRLFVDSREFYELMQTYRLMPRTNPQGTVDAFEAVKSAILAVIADTAAPPTVPTS